MLIERAQTSTFHDDDTLMHHVNCVFVEKRLLAG